MIIMIIMIHVEGLPLVTLYSTPTPPLIVGLKLHAKLGQVVQYIPSEGL
jgi:hypothetical protein